MYVCWFVCRLAYADYIVAKLVEECKVPLEVNLLYDIGCKLISHWKVYSYCCDWIVNLTCDFLLIEKSWSLWKSVQCLQCCCAHFSCICTQCPMPILLQSPAQGWFWLNRWGKFRKALVLSWKVLPYDQGDESSSSNWHSFWCSIPLFRSKECKDG